MRRLVIPLLLLMVLTPACAKPTARSTLRLAPAPVTTQLRFSHEAGVDPSHLSQDQQLDRAATIGDKTDPSRLPDKFRGKLPTNTKGRKLLGVFISKQSDNIGMFYDGFRIGADLLNTFDPTSMLQTYEIAASQLQWDSQPMLVKVHGADAVGSEPGTAYDSDNKTRVPREGVVMWWNDGVLYYVLSKELPLKDLKDIANSVD